MSIITPWELKLNKQTNKQNKNKKQGKEIVMPGEKCEYLHANDQTASNICILNLFLKILKSWNESQGHRIICG